MRRVPLLLAVVAVLVAACSSDSNEEVRLDVERLPEPAEVSAANLASAASQARGLSTGRFEMVMEFEIEGDGESMAFAMGATGEYDDSVPAVAMTMDLGSFMADMAALEGEPLPPGMDGDMTMEMRQIGDVTYMSMSGLADLFGPGGSPGGATWMKIDAEAMGVDTADLGGYGGMDDMGMDPSNILALVEGADGEVTDLGPGEVRGVPTNGFGVEISVAEAVAAQSTPEEAAALEDELRSLGMGAMADLTYPIEIHVDDDGLVRRIELSMDLSAGDMGMAVPGGEFGDGRFSMSVRIDFFDLGADDIVVVAPSDDEVMDLGDMFGGMMGDVDMDELMGDLDGMMGDVDMDELMGDLEGMLGDLESEMDALLGD
jgi:hypothetical protein